MKPAIAYGIHGSHYADDWETISITSEKTGPRGMVYGCDPAGTAMHAKPLDIHGRFDTMEKAEIGLEALRELHAAHAPAIEAARAEYERLSHLRNDTIRQALANIRVHRIEP